MHAKVIVSDLKFDFMAGFGDIPKYLLGNFGILLFLKIFDGKLLFQWSLI
jgi:hypothetical protein